MSTLTIERPATSIRPLAYALEPHAAHPAFRVTLVATIDEAEPIELAQQALASLTTGMLA